MRPTLIFLHIFIAFFAFGGLLRVPFFLWPLVRKPRREVQGAILSIQGSSKPMSLIALVVVALGAVLAYQEEVFRQRWIWMSLVLYVALSAVGHTMVRSSVERAAGKLGSDLNRSDNLDIAAELTSVKYGYSAMALITVAILWLMIFKPA